MARVLKDLTVYLHTPHSSTNRMNHTCLFLPSGSLSSLIYPGRMQGWVGQSNSELVWPTIFSSLHNFRPRIKFRVTVESVVFRRMQWKSVWLASNVRCRKTTLAVVHKILSSILLHRLHAEFQILLVKHQSRISVVNHRNVA